jgi:hypothetical protein
MTAVIQPQGLTVLYQAIYNPFRRPAVPEGRDGAEFSLAAENIIQVGR